jgi:hypothetical protein
VIRHLFDGLDGPYCDLIDKKMRELPGLEWFDLFTKFVREHNIRKAPDSWFPRRLNPEATEIAIAAE